MANLNSLISSQLKRQRPKDTEGGGTFEVALSKTTVLSRIKYVLKTGIDSLDEVTGGLPFGRIVELFGLESCGKSAICIRSLFQAQMGEVYERSVTKDGKVELVRMDQAKTDMATLFVDNEQSIDEDQRVTYKGAQLDCILGRCDTVDQMFKMVDITIDKLVQRQAAEVKAAKDEKREPIIVLAVIVVDTVAGTSSSQEMKDDWAKEDFQRQPKMMRKGFRRMARKINRNNVLMICTNQVSENYKKKTSNANFSVPQAEDFSTFGGRALRYYSSIRVFMYQLQENYKISQSRFSQGFLIGFYTSKNRVVKPCRSARMVILFSEGLNNLFSRLETMIFLGLLKYSKGTKQFSFRFEANGVPLTTFEIAAPSKSRRGRSAGADLEEDDEAGSTRSNDPVLESKAAWPAFYEAHQPECDLLWERAKVLLFEDTATDVTDPGEDETIDLDDED